MFRLMMLFAMVPSMAHAYGVGGLVAWNNPIVAIGVILFFLLIAGYGIAFVIREPTQAFILGISVVGSLAVTYGYLFLVFEYVDSEEGWLRIVALIIALPVLFKTMNIINKICAIAFPKSYKKLHEEEGN